jgi:uncharacterized membrane protein YbaN (DUF454 family)
MLKVVMVFFGVVFLVVGIVGIVVPLLPTSPFLLLASACFLRSSKKLHHWLLNYPVLGMYIKSYLEYGAITQKSRVCTIALLWVTIIVSAFYATHLLWVRTALFVIALSVSIHLIRMKTLTADLVERLRPNAPDPLTPRRPSPSWPSPMRRAPKQFPAMRFVKLTCECSAWVGVF